MARWVFLRWWVCLWFLVHNDRWWQMTTKSNLAASRQNNRQVSETHRAYTLDGTNYLQKGWLAVYSLVLFGFNRFYIVFKSWRKLSIHHTICLFFRAAPKWFEHEHHVTSPYNWSPWVVYAFSITRSACFRNFLHRKQTSWLHYSHYRSSGNSVLCLRWDVVFDCSNFLQRAHHEPLQSPANHSKHQKVEFGKSSMCRQCLHLCAMHSSSRR